MVAHEPSPTIIRVLDQRGTLRLTNLLSAVLETKNENAAAGPYLFMAQLAAITTNIQNNMGYDGEAKKRAIASLGVETGNHHMPKSEYILFNSLLP